MSELVDEDEQVKTTPPRKMSQLVDEDELSEKMFVEYGEMMICVSFRILNSKC